MAKDSGVVQRSSKEDLSFLYYKVDIAARVDYLIHARVYLCSVFCSIAIHRGRLSLIYKSLMNDLFISTKQIVYICFFA